MSKELIYCAKNSKENVGAFVFDTKNWTAEDFACVQKGFVDQFGMSPRCGVEEYAVMISLYEDNRTSNEVYYDWGIAGRAGAWFTVIRTPDISNDQFNEAVREIRRSSDVVMLSRLRIHHLVCFDPEPLLRETRIQKAMEIGSAGGLS